MALEAGSRYAQSACCQLPSCFVPSERFMFTEMCIAYTCQCCSIVVSCDRRHE